MWYEFFLQDGERIGEKTLKRLLTVNEPPITIDGKSYEILEVTKKQGKEYKVVVKPAESK